MKLIKIIKKRKVCIHVKTLEQKYTLIRKFKELDLDGKSCYPIFAHYHHLSVCGIDICYCPKEGSYGEVDTYKEDKYKIIEFEDVEF